VCRAEDNRLYFVKGRGAGHSSLMKEWLAACLARSFELPIPDFEILEVPPDLINEASNGWLADLGEGFAFGSAEISQVTDISFDEAAAIDPALQQRIAVFDWWIKNGDRTLSQHGGNPNIVWQPLERKLWVIDHNLAFDPKITLADQERSHIFGAALTDVIHSRELQDRFVEEFVACLEDWDAFCNAVPERWAYVDDRLTLAINFAPKTALEDLRRYRSKSMWER
jgi:hypothetical protein